MKERGILFSDEMVRALLDGRKTQTRRTVKLPSWTAKVTVDAGGTIFGPGPYLKAHRAEPVPDDVGAMERVHCPYGYPGDRLWAREAHQRFWLEDTRPELDYVESKGVGWRTRYRATDGLEDMHHEDKGVGTWCSPSIFMPRWASRITLEITEVRVQRLHSINEDDARAEGCPSMIESLAGLSHLRGAEAVRAVPSHITTPREEYALLWDRINGDGAWRANPWVWAITFKRVEASAVAA